MIITIYNQLVATGASPSMMEELEEGSGIGNNSGEHVEQYTDISFAWIGIHSDCWKYLVY